MASRFTTVRKALVTGALITGVGFGAAGIASAASGSSAGTASGSAAGAASTSPASSPSAPAGTAPAGAAPGGPPSGSPGDPAAMTHGPGETLLTGTDLQKADAAATAAVPGATVVRAETDSSGASPYEVHMKKSDGTYVTVELDSSFKAVRTVSGFGAGPAGSQAPNGSAAGSSAT